MDYYYVYVFEFFCLTKKRRVTLDEKNIIFFDVRVLTLQESLSEVNFPRVKLKLTSFYSNESPVVPGYKAKEK